MWAIFNECESLISLNLSNFDTRSNKVMKRMFRMCYKLAILDLRNIKLLNPTNEIEFEEIFDDISPAITVCIDDDTNNVFSGKLPATYNSDCSCYLNPNHKIILDTYQCFNNCNLAGEYKFEYNNICYKSCPNYYNYEQTQCIDDIPEGYYLNDTNHSTIDKCNIECNNCSIESNQNNLCIS